MKRKIFRILGLLVCICLLIVEYPVQTNVQAATNYKTAYKNFLNKSNTEWNYFNVLDIDKDGTKELLVERGLYDTSYVVYGFSRGKVRCIGAVRKGGGDSFTYNSAARGLIASYSGSAAAGYGLWKMKKGVLKEAVEIYTFMRGKTTYELNYKKCNKKTFNKYKNKYFNFKSPKMKSYKFVSNNAYNRTKLFR